MSDQRDQIFDELLVLRAQSGDGDAMAALVERWHPRLVRYARTVTCASEGAKDVIQEVWMNAVRKPPSLRDPARFPEWIYRSANNRSLDWLRGQQAYGKLKLRSMASAADSTVSSDDYPTVIGRSMRHLSPRHRPVIALHYLAGHEVAEIAEFLDIPPGTVRSRLHHGRQRLEQALTLDSDHE